MRQRMIADLVAVGHGLLPTRQAFSYRLGVNEKGDPYTLLFQQNKSPIHLARPGVVKAEAHCRALPLWPMEGL